MAEPSTITATAIATGAVTIAGTAFGIPMDALVASTIGAALSVSRADKLELSRASIIAAGIAFALSLSTAIFLGPLLSSLAHAWLTKFSPSVTEPPVRVAVCFVLAYAAHQVWPAITDRIKSEITNRFRSAAQ
jgi:hypothetical protein